MRTMYQLDKNGEVYKSRKQAFIKAFSLSSKLYEKRTISGPLSILQLLTDFKRGNIAVTERNKKHSDRYIVNYYMVTDDKTKNPYIVYSNPLSKVVEFMTTNGSIIIKDIIMVKMYSLTDIARYVSSIATYDINKCKSCIKSVTYRTLLFTKVDEGIPETILVCFKYGSIVTPINVSSLRLNCNQ